MTANQYMTSIGYYEDAPAAPAPKSSPIAEPLESTHASPSQFADGSNLIAATHRAFWVAPFPAAAGETENTSNAATAECPSAGRFPGCAPFGDSLDGPTTAIPTMVHKYAARNVGAAPGGVRSWAQSAVPASAPNYWPRSERSIIQAFSQWLSPGEGSAMAHCVMDNKSGESRQVDADDDTEQESDTGSSGAAWVLLVGGVLVATFWGWVVHTQFFTQPMDPAKTKKTVQASPADEATAALDQPTTSLQSIETPTHDISADTPIAETFRRGPQIKTSAKNAAMKKRLRKKFLAAHAGGKHRDAVAIGRKLEAAFGLDSEAEYAFAHSLRAVGHKRESFRWFEGFVLKHGESYYADDAVYWMGRILQGLGQSQDAEFYFRRVAADPESNWRDRASERLKELESGSRSALPGSS